MGAGNTFGRRFRVTTFGESHGPAIGAVIDGCPPGLALSEDDIQPDLDRRRPGQSRLTTRRDEADRVEILSGVFEGAATGAPVALLIRNADARSQDYDHLRDVFRPSHADLAYHLKYGRRDHRGGGRSSARETAARVAAGAVARKLLAERYGLRIVAWTQQVYDVAAPEPAADEMAALTREQVDAHPARCPWPEPADRMAARILEARKAGDTLGGVVGCHAAPMPAGLGEPVFDKLTARLAYAMMGINAARGFAMGAGFAAAALRGSEHNDRIGHDGARFFTETNRAGGALGGISTGAPLYFTVAFKPVATLLRPQPTVDAQGRPAVVEGKGRHDPCVLPRAVPIVEAMTALVLADFALLHGLE